MKIRRHRRVQSDVDHDRTSNAHPWATPDAMGRPMLGGTPFHTPAGGRR